MSKFGLKVLLGFCRDLWFGLEVLVQDASWGHWGATGGPNSSLISEFIMGWLVCVRLQLLQETSGFTLIGAENCSKL